MALQILPHFLTRAIKKTGTDKEVVILTATSGDTGKAALAGFQDVPGTKIMVFYPEDGVSSMQKRQMQTQEGANVRVCAVKGNFDDCQNGVKAIFTFIRTAEDGSAQYVSYVLDYFGFNQLVEEEQDEFKCKYQIVYSFSVPVLDAAEGCPAFLSFVK